MTLDRQHRQHGQTAEAEAHLYSELGLHKVEGWAVLHYMQLCSTGMCVVL